ncbi:MAG: primosomal protein N' (replication factor Y) - superfamily II helicase [Pseudomonadota bacterium]
MSSATIAPAKTGQEFPCDACGANMRFDPVSGQMSCDHCGNTAELEVQSAGPWGGGNAIKELDFRAALRNQLADADLEETQVFKCTSCGAAVEFESAVHAAECPFCATPIVGGTGTDRHIKPRGLLAFELDEDAARDAMTKWLGRLWFAPNGLQEYARKGRRIQGIYMPYWTYDAQTQSRYTGQRGEVYYVTRRDGQGKTRREARVRWYPARGQVRRFFDDVLVPASRSLPKQVMDALPPWDLSRLRPYQVEYLAGLRAEAYTVELDEGYHEARAYMDRTIERDVRFDIGGDRQRIRDIDTDISNVTFKHVLLPVWVAVYRFQGKPYQILINGQSGRVQGERPYSVWKIALAATIAFVAALGLAYGMMLAEQNGAL